MTADWQEVGWRRISATAVMVAAKIKQGLGLEFGGDVEKAIKSYKMLFWHIIGLD